MTTGGAMKTILIIDDNQDFQDLVKYILEQEQYKVLTASNGKQGVLMARQHHPDLILMDVMMPGNDGRETTAYLQAIRQYKDIPVIFITGVVAPDRVEGGNIIDIEGKEYPMIAKPVDRMELIRRIAEVLA